MKARISSFNDMLATTLPPKTCSPPLSTSSPPTDENHWSTLFNGDVQKTSLRHRRYRTPNAISPYSFRIFRRRGFCSLSPDRRKRLSCAQTKHINRYRYACTLIGPHYACRVVRTQHVLCTLTGFYLQFLHTRKHVIQHVVYDLALVVILSVGRTRLKRVRTYYVVEAHVCS